MSRIETHKGILVEFPRKINEQDKDYIKRFLKDKFTEEKYKYGIENYIYDADLDEDVLFYKNTLYSNENHQELEGDINIFTKTEKGIEYLVNFHNGGTYLQEMLGEGIDEINKKG